MSIYNATTSILRTLPPHTPNPNNLVFKGDILKIFQKVIIVENMTKTALQAIDNHLINTKNDYDSATNFIIPVTFILVTSIILTIAILYYKSKQRSHISLQENYTS